MSDQQPAVDKAGGFTTSAARSLFAMEEEVSEIQSVGRLIANQYFAVEVAPYTMKDVT